MPYFDQEFGEEIDRVFKEKFDLLLGRKTYEIFAGYWPYYMVILVATESAIVVFDSERGVRKSHGVTRPTCLAADRLTPGRAWCGTDRDGVFVSEDDGDTWRQVGLAGRRIQAIAASPTAPDAVWAGTEPSEIWQSADTGLTWERSPGLEALPSSSTWSFPPRPHTHHVRWIACHPNERGRLWVAIEAGALVA